jgi:hypothetical protein
MAASYYLVPVVGTGTRADPYTIAHADTIGRFWNGSMIMGLEPFALVMIRDIDQAAIDELAADVNVTAIPPLNVTVTAGSLATVKAQLEARNIPAGWVTAGMPYSTIVRAMAAYCQLHQRYQGLNAERLLGGAVDLDTRVNQLSQATQAKLSAMADSFGFDRSGITGSTTLRSALKQLLDQWAGSLLIGGESV